jgi:hypothetical protein
MTALAFAIVSCSSDNIKSSTISTSDIESTELNTRGFTSKVASKAYYYNSLASFADGNSKMDLNDLADLEGKQVSFVVLYEASAPWAETFNSGKYNITGDDKLNGLMETYQLEIVKQFDIDDDNEGFVLESLDGLLDNPIEAARELSMVNYVFMVHLKEIPLDDDTVNETAATD